jgi:hypothetical protein
LDASEQQYVLTDDLSGHIAILCKSISYCAAGGWVKGSLKTCQAVSKRAQRCTFTGGGAAGTFF